MSTIYLMIPVTLLIAGGFLLAYIWSVRTGQFEDTTTPAMRILSDEKPVSGTGFQPVQSHAQTRNAPPTGRDTPLDRLEACPTTEADPIRPTHT